MLGIIITMTMTSLDFIDNSGVYVVIAILVACSLGVGAVLAWRRQRASFATWQLSVDGTNLTRRQAKFPDITIAKDEITKITEAPGTGLVVQTESMSVQIGIPDTTENYQDVRAVLSGWTEIQVEPSSKALGRKLLMFAFWLLMLGSMLMIPIATNPALVLGVGFPVTLYLLVSFVLTQRNPHLSRKVKLQSLFLLWIVFLLVMKMISVLTTD